MLGTEHDTVANHQALHNGLTLPVSMPGCLPGVVQKLAC